MLQTIGLKSEHTLAPLVCCFCSTTLTYSPYEHLNFPIILDMGFKIYNGDEISFDLWAFVSTYCHLFVNGMENWNWDSWIVVPNFRNDDVETLNFIKLMRNMLLLMGLDIGLKYKFTNMLYLV